MGYHQWKRDRHDRKEMEAAELDAYRRAKDHAEAEAMRNFCNELDRDNRARVEESRKSKIHGYGPNCMFADAHRTANGRALIAELEDSPEHRYGRSRGY